MTGFNSLDQATWPQLMTADEVAAIYRRSVLALKKACQLGKFRPTPHQVHPYHWRKVDVLRDLGLQQTSLRRAS